MSSENPGKGTEAKTTNHVFNGLKVLSLESSACPEESEINEFPEANKSKCGLLGEQTLKSVESTSTVGIESESSANANTDDPMVSVSNADDLTSTICSNDLVELNSEFLSEHGFQDVSNEIEIQTQTPDIPAINVTVVEDVKSEGVEDMDVKVIEPHDTTDSVEIRNLQVAEKKIRRKRVSPPAPVTTTIYRTRTVVKADLAAQIEKDEKAQEIRSQSMSTSNEVPKAKTMKDVLASIPGFGAGKPRKRNSRKLSAAEQLEQTKEGCIDLETPGSILTQVNLRTVLNKHTFAMLPPFYQFKLLQLLPDVDTLTSPDNVSKPSNSAFNNEFFAKACKEWTSKLLAGDFTPEQRHKKRQEAEREKLKLDPWKVKYFEPIWGDKFVTSTAQIPKPPPTATVTSASIAQSSSQSSEVSQPLRVPPLRSSARLSPSLPLQTNKPITPDTATTSASSSKPSTSVHVEDIKVDTHTEEEAQSEAENDDIEIDHVTSFVNRAEKVEELNQTTTETIARTPVAAQNSTSPTHSDVCSPGKRSSSHLDTTDKPQVLVKKIKIIPPMPPSGEQVPYNMEVKIEEIQPATPIASSSTDLDLDDVDLAEEDSNFSETQTHPENTPVPSPQEYVTISETVEIDISSSPTNEVDTVDNFESDLLAMGEIELLESTSMADVTEDAPYSTDFAKEPSDVIIPESVMESAPNLSSSEEKGQRDNSMQENVRSESSISMRSGDSFMMEVDDSEPPALQEDTAVEETLEEPPEAVLEVQQETIEISKASSELHLPQLTGQTEPDAKPELSVPVSVESLLDSVPEVINLEAQIEEPKPERKLQLSESISTQPQSPEPDSVKVEEKITPDAERPGLGISEVKIPISASPVPPVLQIIKNEVLVDNRAVRTEACTYPTRSEAQPQIIKILTVPSTSGAIKIDSVNKGNTISGVTFPMKFVSLNTTNAANTTRQVQGSTSVRTTVCSPTSATSTIIPVVLKVSNANSNMASVSLAKPHSFINEVKSVPSPRPITPASPLTLSNVIPSRTHENIPIMSTTTTTTTVNPNPNHQQQNTPPENVTTFVVNTLQNTPICTFNDNSSSQSPKSFIIQQQIKPNPLHSLVQSVNASTSIIGPAPGNISSINNNNKRNKKAKQVKIPRSTTAPPGSINLARSYQICQAVIQSSPNREQLQNQLVKPPPVLVTNKLDPTKLLHQQQQQQTQGNNSFGGDPQLVHLQRRASTPTVLQATQIQGSMPMLSGISSNQKVIVVSGGQGGNGPLTIQQQPHSTHTIHPQQNTHMVPLLRPIQPGSPLVVNSGNGRPSLQPHQLVVSSETSSSNPMHLTGQGHSGIGMNVALGQNSHINSAIKNQNISNSQSQSMGTVTGSTTSSAIITSHQLAMLIQQQQQQMQHKQQLLTAHQQQQPRCQSIPVTLSQTPNSPNNVQLTNTSIKNANCGSVFICSPRPGQIPCSIPNNLNSVPHQIKLINSQFSQNSNSTPTSPRPTMNLQHQIVHIPIQRQQNNNSPHMMTNNNNTNNGQMNFPLRAQIVTSNGETLTIHRASNALNEPFTVRPPQRVSIGLSQGKQSGVHQNYFISSEHINSSVVASAISNFGNANSPTLIQNPTPGGNSQTPPNIIFSNPKVGSPGPNMVRSPLRIICRSPQDGGFQTQFVNHLGGNNGSNSSQNSAIMNNNPISNLADFITNQLAASNIRPISPLAFEGNQKSQVSDSVNSNTASPDVIEKQHMVPSSFNNSSNMVDKLNNVICSSPNNMDPSTGVMVVSVVNKNEMPYCTEDNIDSPERGNQSLNRENLFNCNNETLMDLQDAISVSMDSPYSLISEPEPPHISEIIEIPTTTSTGVTITGSTLPNFTTTDSSNNLFVSSYSCMSAESSGSSECSRRTQLQIPSKSKELGTPYCIANNFNPPPPLASTVPSVNLTNSINENHIGLNVPVNVSEVERNTVLVQTTPQSINDQQQQGIDNSLGLGTSLHQQEGVRQQQYFIVQTTGSNGFPTSIAVPASILISPQVLMDQKGQSHSQHGLGIRSSSAPPVQHNHTGNVGNIIVNSNVNGHAPPGTMPISFSTPSSINLPAPTVNSSRVGQIQTFHQIRGQLGEHINLGTSKPTPIPMELQDIRIIRKGPSGQQQHMTLNRGGQEFQQNQFTTSKANSIQSGQYCMTTSGLIPVSHANQTFVSGHQVQLLSGGSPSFSITPVNSNNAQNQNQSSNVVEVQVSRASQPNTLGQVVTVGRRSNEVWSQVCGQTQRQVVNVNLNGTNGSPRIITTTQPGQHPVISIPDTTQNGVNAGGTGGQDFDIFSAIAKVSDGLTIKLEQSGEEHGRGVLISTAVPETINRNPTVERQEFHRLVSDGQLTLENGGNCVCDLRAMIMCRKCGAFCHDDCIGPADLCMTCIIR